MKTLKNRIEDLEKRDARPPCFKVWYANPLGAEPEPRPEIGPGDLLLEVVYVDPPPAHSDEEAR